MPWIVSSGLAVGRTSRHVDDVEASGPKWNPCTPWGAETAGTKAWLLVFLMTVYNTNYPLCVIFGKQMAPWFIITS